MPAHLGDWLVRWLDDNHEPLLFPPPGTQLQCPAPVHNRRASAS